MVQSPEKENVKGATLVLPGMVSRRESSVVCVRSVSVCLPASIAVTNTVVTVVASTRMCLGCPDAAIAPVAFPGCFGF